MITFDKDIGLVASSVEEVREQVANIFIKAFKQNEGSTLNTEPSTPQGQLIDAITALVVEKDNDIIYLANMFDPLKSEGIWQEALGKVYFLPRHQAIASRAEITCRGRAGVFIPTGAAIHSKNDDITKWTCVKGNSIKSDGMVKLVFECSVTGPVSAAPDTLTEISSTIGGWDSATNEQAATVGQDVEGTASFEDRRYKSVALNARSSAESVYSRLADLNGVLAVCVQQNRGDTPITIDEIEINPHSVYVCVLGGDDDAIAKAMYATVSAGCDYTGTTEVEVLDPVTKAKDTIRFNRPEEKAIKLQVSIRKLDGQPSNAESLIKDLLLQNFLGTEQAQTFSVTPLTRVVMGDGLYSSRFYPSLTANNFHSVVSILLSWKDEESLSESLAIPINVCPTLNVDDIEIKWIQGPLVVKE